MTDRMAPEPTFLIEARPKRIAIPWPSVSGVKCRLLELTSGARILMRHSRALSDDLGEAIGR